MPRRWSKAIRPSADGTSYIGLVLNRRGLDRALATTVDELNLVVGASEGFNQANAADTLADREGSASVMRRTPLKRPADARESFRWPGFSPLARAMASGPSSPSTMGVARISHQRASIPRSTTYLLPCVPCSAMLTSTSGTSSRSTVGPTSGLISSRSVR